MNSTDNSRFKKEPRMRQRRFQMSMPLPIPEEQMAPTAAVSGWIRNGPKKPEQTKSQELRCTRKDKKKLPHAQIPTTVEYVTGYSH